MALMQYQLIGTACGFVISFCSMFSKCTQTCDFIKTNVIWKLTYKVKYITQINGGFIMFFRNSRVRFFGLNQYEKKEDNQHNSVFKVG